MIFSRPTTRKVFGELTQHLSRTMLVVLSIAVGITAIGAIAGAFFVLPADMSSSYSASNPPNIELVTDPFDQGLADAIARMPDVADAEAQRWVSVRVQVASGDWRPLRIVAVDSPGATRINQLLPQAGASEPRTTSSCWPTRPPSAWACSRAVAPPSASDGASSRWALLASPWTRWRLAPSWAPTLCDARHPALAGRAR